MSIIAQYLFGSHARMDYSDESDIDVLAVTDQDHFDMFSRGRLNVSFYPAQKLIADAREGALFAMHIIREAVVTYDDADFHSKLLDSFVYRKDYSREIKLASDLARFLLRHARDFKDQAFLNRRINWCVRTILIAVSAESEKPVFSRRELCQLTDFPHAEYLLSLKNNEKVDYARLRLLSQFLERFGHAAPIAVVTGSAIDEWKHFRDTRNSVALKTFGQMGFDATTEIYT
ncbi:putative nucleotidyltransferase [Phyllobacterium sp. 1468]|uniref:anti-phage Hailong system nucleotidyltransferase HalB n=1 Tax=Phyllobacterium sp. 1468 TaxID=2817759 RepID=UPI00285A2FF4|nr:nucleotidyltransferase domain-containing protein [Phyllobacterium sp. 1468]MDR6632292.1 putative nucleotidyltransferase [Phyllobacterium sp. 1468]